uniref:Uncharacterized protein n=1 Tax=Anguilla anguilla TaxID=7936 RepID=A0A0E9WL50_ANGAN
MVSITVIFYGFFGLLPFPPGAHIHVHAHAIYSTCTSECAGGM